MRRTPTTLAVARELLRAPAGKARWSYEISAKISADRGSVSAILQRMAVIGWLDESWENEFPPRLLGRAQRHLYRVTSIGRTGIQELIVQNDCDDLRSRAVTGG